MTDRLAHPADVETDAALQGDVELARARQAAAGVLDPEIPVLTIEDLGILRGVERRDGTIVVSLTPTYTGCPATFVIRLAVETALLDAGLATARVETQLSPPWSTGDITADGRRKLLEFGIAPPGRRGQGNGNARGRIPGRCCPMCTSD